MLQTRPTLFTTDPVAANKFTQKLIWLAAALHLLQAAIVVLNPAPAVLPPLFTTPVNLILACLLFCAGLAIARFERWAFHIALFNGFLSLPLTLIFGMSGLETLVSIPVILVSLIFCVWIMRPSVNTPFARCPVSKGARYRRA